ncbi:hypothetical protein M9Y10_015452 [Tritrichomonas musculus]|uniref:Uncharacterized protein n=1 Tax=Tritrichomonas musculus TaxID=1915356 RepID=A0ABR2L3D7_9EUKA
MQMILISEEFFEKLNSDEESISKDARQEIAVWGTSSSLTDLFCQGRGRDKNNVREALDCLLEAKRKATEELTKKNVNFIISISHERLEEEEEE